LDRGEGTGARPWRSDWFLPSVGEKAWSDSDRLSVAGSKGGRSGGWLLIEVPVDGVSLSLPVSIDRFDLGRPSTSFSSSRIVSAGGEAVNDFEVDRDMDRLDCGDLSRLFLSTLCLFSGLFFSGLCLFSRLCLLSEPWGESILNLSPDPILPTLLPGPILIRSILCLTVFSNSLFLAEGKYSAKWFEMSSEGGRCPKKLYIFFDFVKNDPEAGDRAVVVGEGGASAIAWAGTGTPRPDMTLTVDARFCLLVAFVGVRESLLPRLPKVGRGVAR
jgi:hypothetical protein